MGTISRVLRLDQLDSKGKASVYVIYRHGKSAPFKISTKVKVYPNEWDADKKEFKKNSANRDVNELSVSKTEDLVSKEVQMLKLEERIPTVDVVRRRVREKLDRLKDAELFPEASKKLGGIRMVKRGRRLTDEEQLSTPSIAMRKFLEMQKNQLSDGTLQTYRASFHHLQEYCRINSEKLHWHVFDEDFHYKWQEYFLNDVLNQNGDVGLLNSTIEKYFKKLKAFLRWSQKRNPSIQSHFQDYNIESDPPSIYPLKEDDLNRIAEFADDERNELRLRKVASLFVFLSATGMRFSDACLLSAEDIYKGESNNLADSVLRTITKKTHDEIFIPLNRYALREIIRNSKESLLDTETLNDTTKSSSFFKDVDEFIDLVRDKDEGLLMTSISLVKFNAYIKEVARTIGLDDTITFRSKKGSTVVRRTFKRYEKISSHDCRRTFITLSLEWGMRPETVMSITGHNSLKTMQRYIKVTETAKRKEMMSAWGDRSK